MDIDLTISVPQFDNDSWDYNQSVSKCKNLYTAVRHGGTKLVIELLHAHEMLVKKQIPDKTWGGYCEEIGISGRTIINWFNKYHLTFTQISGPKMEPKNLGSDNPLKKQTKPEVKYKLKEVMQKIKEDEVSDKDIKEVMDTVADKIKEEKVAPNVANKVSTSARTAKRKKANLAITKLKPEFERLKHHAKALADGLSLWAAGRIKPETEEDFEDVLVIRAALPTIIVHASRLGIDINKVLELGTDKQSKEKENSNEKIINIESLKNVGPGT